MFMLVENPRDLKHRSQNAFCPRYRKDRLITVIQTIINYYKNNAKGKEKFRKFVDRVTLGELQRIVG